jgi:large subunit ribosomal protein L15
MKLHDLRPADGARRPRTRVGRGIAAGKGKTAGRGTKGQKARAGGSIPPWFEGGQTPLHMRIPKLRGFRNPFKIEYEVVNVGRIAALVAAGRLEAVELPDGAPKGRAKAKAAPITVNQEILRATGLVSSLDKPMKILGNGEVDVALFVVADAFTRSAREKIEAAGGTAQVIEVPSGPLTALGVEAPADDATPSDDAAPSDDATHATAEPAGSTDAAGATEVIPNEAVETGPGEADEADAEAAPPSDDAGA